MAYYSPNFKEDNAGEYCQTPYYPSSYDIVPFQDIVSHSSHNFTEPKFLEYDSIAYGGAYDPFLIRSEMNYSTCNVTEPKLIEYNPSPYGTRHFSSKIPYRVSYSTSSEFDDTDFGEYDPTPYGGGYDPTLTYGKSLPASDEICYPRSLTESNGLFLDNFSYGSIRSPYGEDDVNDYSTKPRNETKPVKPSEEREQPYAGRVDNGHDHGHETHPEKPFDSSHDEQIEGYTYPWSGYGYDYDSGYRYGCDKQVPQTPYGYGSDAMDLCESLFGYWPCLSVKNRSSFGHQEVAIEESKENQWKGAADYLFGSPYTHGGDEAGDYRGPTYNYERHYQEQHYRYVEGDENS